MSDWQPIETAPKDGTEVLTCRRGKIQAVASYWPRIRTWSVTDGCDIVNVTHWKPLDEPPTAESGRNED